MNETYQVKRWKSFQWRWAVTLLALLGLGIVALAGSYTWLGIAALGAFAGLCVYASLRVYCPQCSGRLSHRTIILDQRTDAGEKQFRHLYDCPKCRVTWDPEIVTDDHVIAD